MGVFVRQDSPYYWMNLERPGQRPLRVSTKIPITAATPQQTKTNKVLAQAVYNARMGDLARQRHDLAIDRPDVTYQTFADWYETHISAAKRGHAREREILKMLRGEFGAMRLAAIDKDRVLEWRTRRLAQVTAATCNRELDVLKHLLRSAVPKYLEASPIEGLPRVRARNYEPQPLSRGDERKLLKVLDADDKAIVILALDTLMRLSDIVNLRRAQDHGKYLTVLDPKMETAYKVPISSRARRALNRVPKRESAYFFPRRRTDQPRNTIKQMLEHACARAGLDYGRAHGFTFHVLRHTGASRMVAAGVDLRTVQEIGGWKNLRQLSRYTHPTDRAKLRAVERIGRA